MKMNKYMLLAATALALVFTGCKSQDPFETQSPDDYPRILYPVNESGSGTFTYTLDNPDAHFLDSCIVTPSSFTTTRWYVDGQLIVEGRKMDTTFLAGVHDLLLVATTEKGLRNERFGTITVLPYAEDPYSEPNGIDRHVAVAQTVEFAGANLDKVKTVRFYVNYREKVETELTNFTATAEKIQFSVPAMAAAQYHMVFVDAEGKEYGANKLIVHDEPVITSGFDRFVVGKTWELKGMNLSEVSSMTIGTTTITELTATADAITLTAPEMEEGEYPLTIVAGTKQATFLTKKGEMFNEVIIICAATQAIIVGEESFIGCNGAAEWTALPITKEFDWSSVAAGTILHVEAEWLPGAEYAKMQILCNESWEGSSGDIDVAQGKAVYDYELTAERLALIQASGHVYGAGAGVHIFRVFMEAPDETVLLPEGEYPAAWNADPGAPTRLEASAFANVRVGATIYIYYTRWTEADFGGGDVYWNFRVIGPWWGPDIVEQIDITEETPNPYEIEYTEDVKKIVEEQGAFCCVGYGYTVNKITWR